MHFERDLTDSGTDPIAWLFLWHGNVLEKGKDNEKRAVTKILTFAHVFVYIFLKTMNYCIFIVEEENSHFSKQLNANCTQTWCDLPVLQQWACCPAFQSCKGFQMEESKSLTVICALLDGILHKIAIAQLASGFGNLNVVIPKSTKSHWKPLNSVALGWRTILTHVLKSHTKQTVFFCLWR